MNWTVITNTDMFEFDAKNCIESIPFLIFQDGKNEIKFNRDYVVAFFSGDVKLKKTSFSELEQEKTMKNLENTMKNFTQDMITESNKILGNDFLTDDNDFDEN